MTAVRIEAVGVLVPARDEQDRLADCLHALGAAVAAVPPTVTVAVCVVADRCRDATAAVARRAGGPGLKLLVNEADLTVGRVRDRGVRAVLGVLGRPAERTWLLHTDADTTVPPGWVLDHLQQADDGADAVVGAVDLDHPQALPAGALHRYAELVAGGPPNAYAANLGVRASAYLQVGGFPPVPSGEEHALLARLRRAGHRVVAPDHVRARTSARLRGRAPDGLADLLHRLTAEAARADAARAETCCADRCPAVTRSPPRPLRPGRAGPTRCTPAP